MRKRTAHPARWAAILEGRSMYGRTPGRAKRALRMLFLTNGTKEMWFYHLHHGNVRVIRTGHQRIRRRQIERHS